jgi:hypothetical protein
LVEEPELTPIRKRLPKKAIAPLMEFCEWYVEGREESPVEFFRRLLENMNRYQDYFFDRPWPKEFVYRDAAEFTRKDIEFIKNSRDDKEFVERAILVVVKKLINYKTGFQWAYPFEWILDALIERLEKEGIE